MDDKTSLYLSFYRPADGWTAGTSRIFASRLSSEVATMQYVRAHTSIPVPLIIHHSVEADSCVRSSYIIMTKVDGVALSSIWVDSKREIVLRKGLPPEDPEEPTPTMYRQ